MSTNEFAAGSKVRRKATGRVGTVQQVYPSGMVEVWFTSTEGRGLTTATFMPTALEPVDIEDYEAGMVEYMVDKVCSLLQRTGLPNKRLYDICNLAGRKFLK